MVSRSDDSSCISLPRDWFEEVDPSSEVVTSDDHQDVPTNAEDRDTNSFDMHDIGAVLPVLSSSISSAASTSTLDSAEQNSQTALPNKEAALNSPVQSSSSSRSVPPRHFPEMMAYQMGCLRALFEPDQEVAAKLFQQSQEAFKNHYARDVETAYASGRGDNIHSFLGTGINSRNSAFCSLLHRIKYPGNNPVRLIHVKGHICDLSVHPVGSCFITKQLDITTTGEVVMLYTEMTPQVSTLVCDVFANSVIMKLLDYGPETYRSKLVRNLIGHVLALSLHQHGSQVIEKVFEIGVIDQQMEMAMELNRNLLKCKVLQFSKDPLILYPFVMEIVERVIELSTHEFGNYVVQYIVQHGEPGDRQIVVQEIMGQIIHLSRQEYSSNVIEKLLIYGSYHERKIIITEILYTGAGDTEEHILGMMVNQHANNVVRVIINVADVWQRNMVVGVAKRNASTLARYIHGRRLMAQVDNLVSTRAVFVAPPPRLA
ncbi:pumilio homolog 1 [Brachypodium distachyon]|uniref:pumilio homolog 1 n=1 Tax=Brachypodium distachyon TaxID=15368 RepID=UPI000D0D4BA3|nr:pumilio homolog 1 [Brachypodium distachyon]|eukprot:XP_024310284.1 pumilio homolog 1 [Brachypodium distachyon]